MLRATRWGKKSQTYPPPLKDTSFLDAQGRTSSTASVRLRSDGLLIITGNVWQEPGSLRARCC
eukprot:6483292-Amphidinium_carterae.1